MICTSPLVIFFYFCHITHLPLIIFFLISVLSSVFFYFLFLFFSDPHTTCLFSTSQFFIYFFAVCAHFILFKCSSSPSSLFFLFFFTWSVESIHNLSVQCAYHRGDRYWLKCPKQNPNWTQPKPSQTQIESKQNPAVNNILMLSGKEAEVGHPLVGDWKRLIVLMLIGSWERERDREEEERRVSGKRWETIN